MSGAELQNVMNEAAILSVRRNKKETDEVDIYDAIDRI
jgi:ATP-dependent Zn protease